MFRDSNANNINFIENNSLSPQHVSRKSKNYGNKSKRTVNQQKYLTQKNTNFLPTNHASELQMAKLQNNIKFVSRKSLNNKSKHYKKQPSQVFSGNQ